MDALRQQIINRRLDKLEDAIKQMKADLRIYRKNSDKELIKFAKDELSRLKNECQTLSDEYEMELVGDFSEDDIIERLQRGWTLTNNLGSWALFAPAAQFGERIEMTSKIRGMISEFGYRAGGIESYKLTEIVRGQR